MKNVDCDQQRHGPIRMNIKESLVMKEVIDEFAHEESQKSFGSNSTVNMKSLKSQTGSSGPSGKLLLLGMVQIGWMKSCQNLRHLL